MYLVSVMRIGTFVIAALFALSGAAFAPALEQAPSAGTPSPKSTAPASTVTVAAAPDLPFTGRETTVWNHAGPDGASVTSTCEDRIVRSSLGQVYLEAHRLTPTADFATTPASFSIVDPAARTYTTCFVKTRHCQVSDEKVEYLSSTTVENVLQFEGGMVETATGTVEPPSLPWPTSSPRPGFSSTSDSWYSQVEKATLGVAANDSSAGTSTSWLTILDRVEPDPSLFAPPAGYTFSHVTPPRILQTTPLQYSDEARSQRVGGEVLISLVVDERGKPTQIRVIRGVGYGLDDMAVEAIKRYKFKPAREDGKPISIHLTFAADFPVYQGNF